MAESTNGHSGGLRGWGLAAGGAVVAAGVLLLIWELRGATRPAPAPARDRGERVDSAAPGEGDHASVGDGVGGQLAPQREVATGSGVPLAELLAQAARVLRDEVARCDDGSAGAQGTLTVTYTAVFADGAGAIEEPRLIQSSVADEAIQRCALVRISAARWEVGADASGSARRTDSFAVAGNR